MAEGAPTGPGEELRAVAYRPAVRLAAYGESRSLDEEVATERPLTLYVGGAEWVTLVATPTHLEELVVGFLASERLITGVKDLRWLAVDPERGEAWVTLRAPSGARREAFGRRVVPSCCGKGRLSLIWEVDRQALTPIPPAAGPVLTPETCLAIMQAMEAKAAAGVFGRTGGVHTAGLADAQGHLRVWRSDIGRHNALDKLYGHALLTGLDPRRMVVAFSGRLSSEVLLKVAKLGAPILLSRSAPTDLAVDLAGQLGLTAAGFVRNDRLTVYAGAHRIQPLPSADR
jgi:FdhD protein